MRAKKTGLIIFFAGIIVAALGFLGSHALAPKEVHLTMGIFAGSNWDVPTGNCYRIFDTAIERFEELHPNVKITYRSGTLKEDYSEWFAQKILQDEQPDVFLVLSEDFSTFASIGVLKNLNGLIEKDTTFDPSCFYSTALRAGQLSETQYALPFETAPVMMFVNKTLLEKENIPLPSSGWTWDEFYDICQRVTKDTDDDGVLDQFGSYGFTWQDAVFTDDNRLFDETGTHAYFNTEKIAGAIRFARKIHNLNQNYRVTSDDYDNGVVAFRPFPFSSYRAYKPYPFSIKKFSSFEWDCVTLPAGTSGKSASELRTLLMGMSTKTEYEREAWELIKFLTYDEETQMNLFRYSQGVSVLPEINESPQASEELRKDMPGDENFIDMQLLSKVIENSSVAPKFKKYDAAMEMADKELFQVVYNDKNIEDSLAVLQREIEDFLQQ